MTENPPRLNVSDLIDSSRFSPYQWSMLVLGFTVVMMEGFDAAAIGFVAPAIKGQWHLTPELLSPIFGAGLAGLMAGGLVFGPAADRFGRKSMVILSVLLFGLFSVMSYAANSVQQLVALRFIAGLGFGGAMPNIVTLMSEYSPARLRATVVTVMICGFPLGSALAGFATSQIEPVFGWKAVLVVGGSISLLMLPLLILLLPESACYLMLRGKSPQRVARLLRRINPTVDYERVDLQAEQIHKHRSPVRTLLGADLLAGTALFWVCFACGLLITYLLTSWLPIIIHDEGIPIHTAALVTALYQCGGVIGALTLGPVMDRFNGHRVVGLAYLMSAALLACVGLLHTMAPLAAAVFMIGFCISGSQASMNALAAAFYPVCAKATGVGWANAIGRIGAIGGAMIGGYFLHWGWSGATVLLAGALPALVCALANFRLARVSGRRSTKPPHQKGPPVQLPSSEAGSSIV
jgi:MFS transporter, AAHS family, 4-hydroxybenzoate transporter